MTKLCFCGLAQLKQAGGCKTPLRARVCCFLPAAQLLPSPLALGVGLPDCLSVSSEWYSNLKFLLSFILCLYFTSRREVFIPESLCKEFYVCSEYLYRRFVNLKSMYNCNYQHRMMSVYAKTSLCSRSMYISRCAIVSFRTDRLCSEVYLWR